MPSDERNALDVNLLDADLLEELELTTTLIVAANNSDMDSLTQIEIDSALGIEADRHI